VSPPAQLDLALVGVTHPFRGGISHYSTLLCRALRERHAVRFYSLSRQYPRLLFPGRSQIDESAVALRVEHEPTIDSCNPWTWLRTARRIVRQRPDLLVISWWHPFFAPAFGTIAHVARRAGIPSCFLCHNAVPHERSPVDRLLLRYAFSAAAVFIVHSRQDRDDLVALRPRARVLHHPHPSYAVFAGEDTLPEAEAKRRLGLGGKRVLLFFGFVREYKGLDVLLAALEQLDPAEGHHLLVVGEFYDDRERYRAALERLAARGQLTLVDRYVPNEEIPLYFSAADLVMVPYLTATQSGVIQIAYGFGKPVVATAVGGIPEVVAEGRTGFLVPPGDGAAIADAVRRYFAEGDPDRFRREIAVEHRRYSWEAMVDTVERAHETTRDR
jgi:glycosyltransferase involved in cell wall biosynthesis